MPERIFPFIQMDLPWELGPPDGRWLLRSAKGEVDSVIVLGTVGARRRTGRGRSSRKARAQLEAEQPTVPVTRATVIDPVPLSAERQAQAWLEALEIERETLAAVKLLNRIVFAHRVATADPYVHELFPSQALAIRAGYGQGEQVADGRWLYARELQWSEPRGGRRVAALRPQERLAVLLGSRGRALQCEEHALRARLDLDHGRAELAAVELERAYLFALHELASEGRADLAERIAELEALRPGVIEAARSALPGGAVAADGADLPEAAVPGVSGELRREPPDQQLLRHALERLEAVLRARTAAGFQDRSSRP
jgi:hypothetical protein